MQLNTKQVYTFIKMT